MDEYICLDISSPASSKTCRESERNTVLDECFSYNDELRKNGHLLAEEPLLPAKHGGDRVLEERKGCSDRRSVRGNEGALGGIQMLEARDLNHAIQLISQCPGVKLKCGSIEIRPAADIDEIIKEKRAAAAKRKGRLTMRAPTSASAPPKLTETAFLAQSVCGVLMPFRLSSFKRGLWITVAVVLAPMLFVGVVALAAGDWHEIGRHHRRRSGFGQFHLSSEKRPAQRLDPASSTKNPPDFPREARFVELRARVRFNCVSGSATPNSEWFYSADHSGKLVVSKKTRHDDQFGSSRRATSERWPKTSFVNRNKPTLRNPQSRLKLTPHRISPILFLRIPPRNS